MLQKDVEIFKGVKALEVNILELTSEHVTYEVKNTPICQYDQHSRARIGIKFYDYKVSELPEYVFYTKLWDRLNEDQEFLMNTIKTLEKLEKVRSKAKFKDQFNLMTRNCSYIVKQDFQSLRGQMSRRLKFCEEEFIVGLHWLLRHKLIQAGNIQAQSFLPGCDSTGICDYASSDYLSNIFGCLFAGCNRWASQSKYASFNESCTTANMLEDQLSIYNLKIPRSKYELENTKQA